MILPAAPAAKRTQMGSSPPPNFTLAFQSRWLDPREKNPSWGPPRAAVSSVLHGRLRVCETVGGAFAKRTQILNDASSTLDVPPMGRCETNPIFCRFTPQMRNSREPRATLGSCDPRQNSAKRTQFRSRGGTRTDACHGLLACSVQLNFGPCCAVSPLRRCIPGTDRTLPLTAEALGLHSRPNEIICSQSQCAAIRSSVHRARAVASYGIGRFRFRWSIKR